MGNLYSSNDPGIFLFGVEQFSISTNLCYISSLENSGIILDNAADKNNPTNLILLIVINDNPASCKRSNLVSINPVKTINKLMITVIFDLFISLI